MRGSGTISTEQLRACGLRVTAPRRAVLDWLVDHPHATVDDIHRGVVAQLPQLSKQAVYDVLAACSGVGLVRRIEPAGHPARFERRADDNHHHLVCRCCGRIQDSDCETGTPPCIHPPRTHGFAIDEAEIVFWGLCGDCRSMPETHADTDAGHRAH